ncbi:fasciclin-2-like isoform X2 [Aricia agestis]|uniref:fasciclin-2-like isoform X1 n=1 Tax=Aricia agestis TaxID=91739 RepID=UPI001C20820B|nr:fasciclin-2-like isoform X1 [Aricia agestis]XP_041981360.1 fasciclin-2-like isoform X2 [Aricia agestis]
MEFKVLFLCLILQHGTEACFTYNQVENTKVKTGSSFYQECHCDDPGTGINLKWLDSRDKEIVPLGPGTKSNVYSEWMDKSTYSVFIANITKSISGAYKCITVNNGKIYTLTYNVEAYDPPYFVNTESTQYVVSGRDALVTCEARGETEPMIAWHKDREGLIEIANDEKYEVSPKGLHIKDITKHDSGVYKCTASDLETGEGIDRDINVEVISVPIITGVIATPNSKVHYGGSLTIECLASGVPHPEYTWRKINDTAKDNTTWRQVGNKIIFDSVEAADQGTYECTATNSAGNYTMGIPIQVLIPPTITQFDNVTAVEGSTMQIVCKASGQPMPKINLMYVGEEPTDQSIVWNTKNVSETEIEFYLTFLKVNWTHAGTYLCNASNEVDYVTEEMTLTVEFPPFFPETMESAWSWRGRPANLSCEHLSNPPSEVTWRYHANEVPPKDQVDINRLIAAKEHDVWLSLDDANLYGIFECIAKNRIGETRKMINLQEGSVPPIVNNVTTMEITATSAAFSIQAPEIVNGPPIIGYRAEYDELQNYNITDIHTNRTWSIDRSFKVDKLKANTSYLIKFAAINEVGVGGWSDFVEFVTLERKPTMSPPDEPVWDVSKEDVAKYRTLRWKSLDTSEPIDYYVLRQCLTYNGSIDDDYCIEIVESSTEYHITGAGDIYFELVAHNSLGNSSALYMIITLTGDEEPLLSAGGVIGLSIVVVFVCLVLLDLLLLTWRRQGILANCCFKKKDGDESLNSRDKKELLKDGESTKRPSNGHKEYEYNKTTGVITGKHSAV